MHSMHELNIIINFHGVDGAKEPRCQLDGASNDCVALSHLPVMARTSVDGKEKKLRYTMVFPHSVKTEPLQLGSSSRESNSAMSRILNESFLWKSRVVHQCLRILSAAGESWRTFYSSITFASSSSTFPSPSSIEFRTVETSQYGEARRYFQQ
jgi:hypothetical protein